MKVIRKSNTNEDKMIWDDTNDVYTNAGNKDEENTNEANLDEGNANKSNTNEDNQVG